MKKLTPELMKKLNKIQWFHKMNFGPDVSTNGLQDSLMKFIKMPNDLKGWTVLDIGAWDGHYSFEAEKRGAKKVVALDTYAWHNKQCTSDIFKSGKDGFFLAKEIYESNIEDIEVEIEDISPKTVGGKYDLVLCLGIIYHMENPMKVLRNMFSVTKKLLILESHCCLNGMYDHDGYMVPAMKFFPGDMYNNDPSNWWGPNSACLSLMLKEVGFKRVEVFKMGTPGRVAFHAHV